MKIIVNKNTNRIYQMIEPKENSQIAKPNTFYCIRSNGLIDFNREVSMMTVKKWLHRDYAIICRNMNQALYFQAILRRDKSTGFTLFGGQKVENYEIYNSIAKKIVEEHPEDIL